MAADHGQTGGAAIHLVNLFNVMEPPDAPAFDEVAVGRGERAEARLRPAFIELARAYLLCRPGVGGQNLLGEIEREPRGLFVFVLREALFDLLAEFGMASVKL